MPEDSSRLGAERFSVRTTCPYCGVGCGVLATARADGSVAIAGDPDHPANAGRLCSKGSALGETLSLGDRLLYPLADGKRVSWDHALDLAARRFRETIDTHGPDAVAFYVSGQLLTEDYYVANKLMKGFIGSANIDTNSRLCMASSVAGHKRAFGSDTVPGVYEDIELADLVVLVGSNLAWCHPVLFQRLAAAKETHGTKVIFIDPRRTATAEIADQHLALAPGSDVALFNGLLAHLAARGRADAGFVERHTNGSAVALQVAAATGFDGAVAATELPPDDLSRFYDAFAATERVVAIYSQGVNQSSAGTDKVNAIVNCHLLTGRIGRPGMGPFSVTGQPNAMGGREVGGLANQLAAHMEIDNPAHRRIVGDFWSAPRIADRPGLKAVDMFAAVGDGRIKALWIISTNPVDSLPEADKVEKALRACPFVVVSEIVRDTDTARHAHLLLPAAAWGEKNGTITNSERCIARQRAFLPAPGEARPDWWIVAEVAKRMGFAGFDYANAAAVFREHAALSAAGNDGTRDFDIGGAAGLDDDAYDRLAPFQWPLLASGTTAEPKRFFGDGRFYTPDGRARFVPTRFAAPKSRLTPERPLVLNTGRIRDQWHTMTRTAKSARLSAHMAEPFVEIHPDDARRAGVAAADLAAVESAHGAVVVRVLVTERQRRGSVFVPIHWTDQGASRGRVDALVAANTDPISGQPELKYTPVSVRRWPASWFGFAVLARRPRAIEAGYWALAVAEGGWRLELAGESEPADWAAFARGLLGVDSDQAELSSYTDARRGERRFAAFADDRLVGAVFVATSPVGVSRGWATDLLTRNFKENARSRVLAGRGGADTPDPGPIVCVCFSVGAFQIAAAASSGCATIAAVGEVLQAGTNCGSCRPEINRILTETQARSAA